MIEVGRYRIRYPMGATTYIYAVSDAAAYRYLKAVGAVELCFVGMSSLASDDGRILS